MPTFLVIDTETTGTDLEKDRVVEVAVVLTDLERTFDHVSVLVDPGIPIPAAASAIHHLTDADVAGKRQIADAMAFLLAGVRETHDEPIAAVAAHNAPFDRGFVGQYLPPEAVWLDTCRMARRYLPGAGSFGNQYLRYHLKLDVPQALGRPAHRAEADALVTAALLRHMLNGPAASDFNELGVDGIEKKIADPLLLETVGFGKHKGRNWSEVPADYLHWFLRNSEGADPDTLHTVKHWWSQALGRSS